MIGLNIIANGVAKFTHNPVVVFYAIGFFCYFIGLLTVYIILQPKGGKHCQPSSTSFGLVDRFKGNYSATGRANSSSGRGKSITKMLNKYIIFKIKQNMLNVFTYVVHYC